VQLDESVANPGKDFASRFFPTANWLNAVANGLRFALSKPALLAKIFGEFQQWASH
jgi:hypothetical protein